MKHLDLLLFCAIFPFLFACKGTDSSPYYAQGRIIYNDGKPAVGVSVSDGFRVTVTDRKGHYRLSTCPDTRYIYFSYPSDALIQKDKNGLPSFFRKYDIRKQTYNFRLRRTEVANEFALFAFADPQAHFQIRDTQTTADTDRFLNESVPAINSTIGKLSSQGLTCCGVTLGDIVYSEKNRNSTPGLEIMRNHFSKLDLPLFQTMGNHDYTFFKVGEEIHTDECSSSINLLAQRTFEECFGPVNHSFNIGQVHIVCMKDVDYLSTSNWDWSNYSCGFSKEQYEWLEADLANVPKEKMVILCIHIPLDGNPDKPYVQPVLNLVKQYANATIFSGHNHFYRGIESSAGSGMFEHVHSAVCGQWWWSKIQGDGCPQGYTYYIIDGTKIRDAHFVGIPEEMDSDNYQMRIYRGGLTYGGKDGRFKCPYRPDDILINVFSGDARWKVNVYEDGVLSGEAQLMDAGWQGFKSVSGNEVKELQEGTSQDWWAIGYHIGVCGRGLKGVSYYESNYHMWKYSLSNASAKIRVEATDPYGNVFSCEEVVSDGTAYPEYIKVPLNKDLS